MGDIETIASKTLLALKQNKVKLYELEEYIMEQFYNNEYKHVAIVTMIAEDCRRNFLEEELGIKLPKIRAANINIAVKKENLILKGIENKIGCITIPLGIAGPLKINAKHTTNSNYIPLATNEAALIAGLQKGIKICNIAGGVSVILKYNGITRSILVETESMQNTMKLSEQLNSQSTIVQLQQHIEEHAEYTKLLKLTTHQIANKLWIRFSFDTSEAMGMNSATKYSVLLFEKIKSIFSEFSPQLVSLSGNLCVDKKVSYANILLGRGYELHAQVIIDEKILIETYNCTIELLHKLNYWKNYIGSSLAGAISNNAHAANIIAAIFAATGQDLAQLGEASICFTTTEVKDKKLYFSITLPSLPLGTIGGGCNKATAEECLNILQCNKKDNNNTKRLAEIIAATVLCSELNLLATLTNETELADSHIRLARGE